MIDILDILKELEWGLVYRESSLSMDFKCPYCGTDTKPTHNSDCQLKAAIDALESGRLVVVDIKNNKQINQLVRSAEKYEL